MGVRKEKRAEQIKGSKEDTVFHQIEQLPYITLKNAFDLDDLIR